MPEVMAQLRKDHCIVLSKIRSKEVDRVKNWCKENLLGSHKVEAVMVDSEIFDNHKKCIGTIVWLKEADDLVHCKLYWWDYQ